MTRAGKGVRRKVTEWRSRKRRKEDLIRRDLKMSIGHLPNNHSKAEKRGKKQTHRHELKNTRINTHVSLMGVLDWHHPSF